MEWVLVRRSKFTGRQLLFELVQIQEQSHCSYLVPIQLSLFKTAPLGNSEHGRCDRDNRLQSVCIPEGSCVDCVHRQLRSQLPSVSNSISAYEGRTVSYKEAISYTVSEWAFGNIDDCL